MWVICLITLFSSLLKNNTGVSLCIGGTVLLAYLLSIIPNAKWYSPTILMNTNSLLMGVEEIDAYIKSYSYHCFLVYSMRCCKYSDYKQEAALSMCMKYMDALSCLRQ